MADQGAGSEVHGQVKVWDAPTRIFHWALVLLVALNYATGEIGGFDFTMPGSGKLVANMEIHMLSGQVILMLLVFRLIWGVAGSTTARFTDFVRGPGAILGYLRDVTKRGVKFFAGHNPAGGIVVALFLILLLAQGGTGLFSKEDDFFGLTGPLNGLVDEDTAKSLTRLHHRIWGYLELLIVIHILANLIYWVALKQNLIAAMFTGKKTIPEGASAPALRFVSPLWGVAALFAAMMIVWGVTELGR